MDALDKISYIQLAKLHRAMQSKVHTIFVEYIIESFVNINFRIPVTNFLQSIKSDLMGCTALHLAFSHDNLEVFELLLKRNIDFTIKNHKNMTVVHQAIEENFEKREMTKLVNLAAGKLCKKSSMNDINNFIIMQRVIEVRKFNKHDNWRLRKKLEDPFVNSVLLAHLKYNHPSNPCSDNGITHFHAACMCNNIKAVEFFLENGENVNQAVNFNSPIYAGYAALHFAIDSEMLELLLRYKANINLKNAAGLTPLDLILDHNLKIVEWMNLRGFLPYDNCIECYMQNEKMLTVLLKDYNGEDLSSLQVACTLSDTSVAKHLLKNGTNNINECSSADSPLWPGYSALHFAAFFNMELVKLLLEHGADIEVKNANGVTPFDICVSKATIQDIYFILSSKESWKNIVLSDGKSLLTDLILAMENMNEFDTFLENIDVNSFVPVDSPFWPGYTILHLVVLLSGTTKESAISEKVGHDNHSMENKHRVRMVKACLLKNADVNIQDTRGWTPIHLAFRQRNMTVVGLLLNTRPAIVNLALNFQLKMLNLADSDNLSLLHIACAANDFKVTKALVLSGADINGQIISTFRWQNDYHNCVQSNIFNIIGSTPLHIAVTCGYVDIVKILLTHDADVAAKDADDLSPIHRNFVLKNFSDSANELLKKQYRTSSSNRRIDYINFHENYRSIAYNLMSVLVDLKESVVSDLQLSHLHVASFENNDRAIDRLLALGSDINLAIEYPKELKVNHPLFFLCNRVGERPVCVANSHTTEKLLIQRGADVLAKQANGRCWLFKKLANITRPKVQLVGEVLKNNDAVKECLFKKSGWTLLHANCLLLQHYLCKESLTNDVDVNARTSLDSAIYPGSTALHILMMSEYNFRQKYIRVFNRNFRELLNNKDTDVMVTDVEGDTPIHQSAYYRQFYGMCEGENTMKLLKCVRNFKVNPVSNLGISIFHIACSYHDIRVIEEYLNNGVDVNEPVEFFVLAYAGYTPLHLAFLKDVQNDYVTQLEVVELLLKYGADVRAVDANDDTPLHAAVKCRSWSTSVLEKLIEAGADINATNIYGKTPLEELLFNSYSHRESIEFFIRLGCRMNSYNPITQTGYLTELISRPIEHTAFQAVMSCPSIDQIDDFGRNVIHNIVSTPSCTIGSYLKLYANVIDYLIKRGCDIDKQDKLGRTALHLAAYFRNHEAVKALLMYGADVNITDINGKTAFTYALGPEIVCLHSHFRCNRTVIEFFAKHVFYLSLYGLYVCKSNRQAHIASNNQVTLELNVDSRDSKCWLKLIRISLTSITLDHFLSDTGAVTNYRKMTEADRNAVDEFFETAHGKYCHYYANYLCKLQYKKALKRTRELIENARQAMNALVGFPFPELCFDFVEKFLSNDDLKNLIESLNHQILL